MLHMLGWVLSLIGGADHKSSDLLVTNRSAFWNGKFWQQFLQYGLLSAVTYVIVLLGQQWWKRRMESASKPIASKSHRRLSGEGTSAVRSDIPAAIAPSVPPAEVSATSTCAICYESYDSASRCPRILSCGHTYCQQCLTNIRKLKRKIECPLHCKDREPVDEVTALVKNYAVVP